LAFTSRNFQMLFITITSQNQAPLALAFSLLRSSKDTALSEIHTL
jgi:hypothetical protein